MTFASSGDSSLDQLTVMLSSTHHQASGQILPQKTAASFALALLCTVQEQCRQVSQAVGVPVRLVRMDDNQELYLVAGDVDHESISHTPVLHLVRALLLREPEAPRMGLRASWQALPPVRSAHEYRIWLRRSRFQQDLGVYVTFLALTQHHIRIGLSPGHAQQVVARQLAENLNLTIVTDGQLYVSASGAQAKDPSSQN